MALRHAAACYAWLSSTRFESIFGDLKSRHGFSVGGFNSAEIILQAALSLEQARDSFLKRIHVFEAERKQEKLTRRVPTRKQWIQLWSELELGESIYLADLQAQLLRESLPIIPDGVPLPQLSLGQPVQVCLNAYHQTPHLGTIRFYFWHWKDQTWYYLLEKKGRKISKRYRAEDLLLL
jgi:hypothetical protein